MKKKDVVKYFRGKDKLNCAQAILKAYQGDFNIKDHKITEFEKYGGGKAVGGLCGALFAVKSLIDNEDLLNQIEQRFHNSAGATTCGEIRKLKKLSCNKCVETISDSLDEYIKGMK